MGKRTVTLSDDMQQFVSRQARDQQHPDEAEYIRSLIRREQYGAFAWDGSADHLQALIPQAEQSGTAIPASDVYIQDFKSRMQRIIEQASQTPQGKDE